MPEPLNLLNADIPTGREEKVELASEVDEKMKRGYRSCVAGEEITKEKDKDPSLSVSPERLAEHIVCELKLERRNRSFLILDCRTPGDFEKNHINTSLTVTLPSILYKRLLKGTLSPCSVIAAKDIREWFLQKYRSLLVVLVPETPDGVPRRTQDENGNNRQTQVADLLLKKLRQDGCSAKLLKGGFSSFVSQFPHLCTGASGDSSRERPFNKFPPLLNLQALSLEDSTSSSCSESCYSSPDSTLSSLSHKQDYCGTTVDASSAPTTPSLVGFSCPEPSYYLKMNGKSTATVFPVEILDFLYLGNAQIAEDRETLASYGISYILNVTPNLPNAFEDDKDFKYLQIPIDDHWSQNLASYFPAAIAFIDEARARKCGVLVHCLAGISRSVTVTLAYLMQTLEKSLDEAYEIVKERKPNISPNFNFMGQLLDFERQLYGGCSPDSGRSSCEIFQETVPPEAHFLSTPKLLPVPVGKKSNRIVSGSDNLQASVS